MANTWTKEQQQVIDLRGCDMLVSAAAGSGKTAVLVERIISRILDEQQPVDIDRLLVVTFTNAAAAEMRERIRDALEQRLEDAPENVHLQRQVTLVHHALITTIHSFCLEVIRTYFHTISLDPGFRVGDEGELKLLRHDVIEQVLEEAYQEREEDFLLFSETFATGRSDKELEERILQVYDFSMGYPWPKEWLRQCLSASCPETMEEFLSADWMKGLLKRLHLLIDGFIEKTKEAIAVCEEEFGPYPYEDALNQDLALLKRLQRCETYLQFSEILRGEGLFAPLSRKRDRSIQESKKERVKEARDEVKKSLQKIIRDYFFASPEQMLADLKKNQETLRVLISLAEKFGEAYAKKKAQKNLVDFNDLEQFALQILVKKTPEGYAPTPAALDYAGQFEEIMIDEYQDSNLVQEILLNSVSRSSQGGHNRFMVGDVKQSIYRFRLARPELFMEKYRTYDKDSGAKRRISLHKNFRSRSQVLDGVNLLFSQLMSEAVGGIEYDEEAALFPGAVFEPGVEEELLENELILVQPWQEEESAVSQGKSALEEEGSSGEEDEDEEKEESDTQRREAYAAAGRILQLVGRQPVWDAAQKHYRPARFGDIVILLRTVAGWADTFAKVFAEMGIPAHTGGSTGYFSALEVRTILSFLKVLDNPRQDIPLAAVLRSPIGGLTDEEMAQVRIHCPEGDFYTCCIRYLEDPPGTDGGNGTAANLNADSQKAAAPAEEDTAKEGEKKNGGEDFQDRLFKKLQQFFAMMNHLRGMVNDTPMHLLLWKILEETGYGDYAAAMPGGAQRTANLQMLVEKAVAYEATSYRGLFNFVRYIENLQKYEIDYGEASVDGEGGDTVRILSIHKSKGLEFPIVFVCGLGKTFNRQDSRSRLVMHPLYGIGCDYVDPVSRVKLPLLTRKVIARQIEEESLGEEIRVLYVALTRAKEKLILMGSVKDLETSMRRWSREGGRREEKLSYAALTGASTYLDWIMPALLRTQSGQELLRLYDLPLPRADAAFTFKGSGSFYIRSITQVQQRESALRENERVLELKDKLFEAVERLDPEKMKQARLAKVLQERYPYEGSRRIPSKLTVSELKRMGSSAGTEGSTLLYEEPVVVPLLPKFEKPSEEQGGAARGTVYHRFLENLDFCAEFDSAFAERQLEKQVKCGKILQEEAAWISLPRITRFLNSALAKRMQTAARAGKLYREQPFVLSVPADTIHPEWDDRETVLLQGIIDAWFCEGDSLVLIDYKTDYVREGAQLTKRYAVQLACYGMALERLTGKKVSEMWIYSFCLHEAIRADQDTKDIPACLLGMYAQEEGFE